MITTDAEDEKSSMLDEHPGQA